MDRVIHSWSMMTVVILVILSWTQLYSSIQKRPSLWKGIVRKKARQTNPRFERSRSTSAKLHLTHGGRGDIGDENTAIIFRGYSGTCDHSLLHLPFPLRQMGYAYGDDSIFVCGGTSDIVGEQGTSPSSNSDIVLKFRNCHSLWVLLTRNSGEASCSRKIILLLFYDQ